VHAPQQVIGHHSNGKIREEAISTAVNRHDRRQEERQEKRKNFREKSEEEQENRTCAQP